MDVISHALWAGAAAELLHRRGVFSRRQVFVAAAFGAMPDLVGLVPVSASAAGSPDPWAAIVGYVTAIPSREPELEPWARELEHVLHCSAHSVLVLGCFALLAWRLWPKLWAGILGWGLHIALDVPTHSASYYAVTPIYPISGWSFDGLAWATTPAVLALNWALLAATYLALWLRRGGRARGDPHGAGLDPPGAPRGPDA